MRILGTGIDLCDQARIAKSLDRFGQRFLDRCFTPIEQARAQGHAAPATVLAKRFAAKEAFAKALGVGIGHQAFLTEIGVVNDALGRPTLALTGRAAETLQRMTPTGHQAEVHLSLTDEAPYALAQVTIVAYPDQP